MIDISKIKPKEVKKYKFGVYTLIFLIILAVYAVLLIALVSWGLMKSMHQYIDFAGLHSSDPVTSIPGVWTLENYKVALEGIHLTVGSKADGTERMVYLPEMFLNSLVYSIGTSVIHIMTACIVAYMTVKHQFKFNKVVNFLYFFALMVPILGSTPSSIRVTEFLHLRDTWIGMFIMEMNFVGGTGYLLFQSYFRSVDDGYKEAALIDGASHFQIMVKIMIPLVRPLIFTFVLISFIGHWNEYQRPLLFLRKNPTAAYGLYRYSMDQQGQTGGAIINATAMPCKVAGYMLLIIPMFALFMVFKNKLMGNLSEGGIKG